MFGTKKIACIIPARLSSTRFPRKVLATLKSKPLLQWVWEAAKSVPLFDEVVFAVDADETAELVSSFGAKFHMTPVSCLSGTERLVCLLGKVDADIWVNWQGDEPFITQQMIHDLLQSCGREESDVWTLKKRIVNPAQVSSPQFAKVVTDHQGFALYFSRSPIPYYRDAWKEEDKIIFKHVGIYAFTRLGLEKIAKLPPCHVEMAEQLEQLRFLYGGLRIRVHETEQEVIGIDLPEHLALAEAFVDRLA